MIRFSSKDRARLDVGVAAGLMGTAVAPGAEPDTRGAAALGAAATLCLGALTDYEGGAVPRLSLAQHRLASAGLGAGLCAWGLRHGGRGGGWALALAGSMQVAAALAGLAAPAGGPPDPFYQPLDAPKPFTDGLWVVDSGLGPIPVRMAVIRLHDGGLLLYSPTRHSPALQAALEALGPIRHLVAPSIAHWVFMKSWQDAVPAATSWAAPNLSKRGAVQRAGLRIDHVLADAAPSVWADEIEHAVIRGAAGYAEVAMFHRPSRTALLVDIVQNFEARKLSWLLRPVARGLGILAPGGRAPAHLRAVVKAGGAGPAAARRIVDWAPQRVLLAHGAPIERDTAATLRRSLAWLTG